MGHPGRGEAVNRMGGDACERQHFSPFVFDSPEFFSKSSSTLYQSKENELVILRAVQVPAELWEEAKATGLLPAAVVKAMQLTSKRKRESEN